MMFRKFLVAGAMVAITAGAYAQGSTSMSQPSMKAGSMNHSVMDSKSMGMGTASMGMGSHALGSNKHLREPSPAPKSAVPPFKKVDTNGDGEIEWSEAKAVHVPKKFFKKEDYEHNGKLDRTEWMLVGFDESQAKAKAKAKNKG